MTILSEKTLTAKKIHRCDAWNWVREHVAQVEDAYRCKGINPGGKYVRQVHTLDGFTVFKSCQGCDEYAKQNNVELNDWN